MSAHLRQRNSTGHLEHVANAASSISRSARVTEEAVAAWKVSYDIFRPTHAAHSTHSPGAAG